MTFSLNYHIEIIRKRHIRAILVKFLHILGSLGRCESKADLDAGTHPNRNGLGYVIEPGPYQIHKGLV